MTIISNGHRVTFTASGQIFVDDRLIQLGVRMASGGHYSYARDDVSDASGGLAGRKLTAPGKGAGKYEAALAAEIISTLFI